MCIRDSTQRPRSIRSSLRHPRRSRPAPSVLRQFQPAPPFTIRRPTTQPSLRHNRPNPNDARPRHGRLRSPPSERRPNKSGDPAMPKAIRRSVHLPPTRKQHRLTNAIEASFSRQVRLRQIGGCPTQHFVCLLYTSPSPRDRTRSRMPSSA